MLTQNLFAKNKKITLGNVIGNGSWVGGEVYYIVDSATIDGVIFKSGSKFAWVDPDEELFTEYVGYIEKIIVTKRGSVEVTHDMTIGRLDLEDLILINK